MCECGCGTREGLSELRTAGFICWSHFLKKMKWSFLLVMRARWIGEGKSGSWLLQKE